MYFKRTVYFWFSRSFGIHNMIIKFAQIIGECICLYVNITTHKLNNFHGVNTFVLLELLSLSFCDVLSMTD